VRVRAEAGQIAIEVEDSGPGLPPEELAKVFDRFYRVEQGRPRGAGGAGLGLAIARWSVEIHGGKIEVQSVEGCGCTFRMALPSPGALKAPTVKVNAAGSGQERSPIAPRS
jgi:signal transduction histidine kinase